MLTQYNTDHLQSIALGISYQGQHTHGWQRQPRLPSIQNHIEQAVSQIANHPVTVHAAGRTDAGVHAALQIAHFNTYAQRNLNSWLKGTNRYLPPYIRILWAKPMPIDFHARFKAQARYYRYILYFDPIKPALWHKQVGHIYKHTLKFELLAEALSVLIGKHDFSSFRSVNCQAKSPIKNLFKLEIKYNHPCITIDFAADGFLHNMIRNILGAGLKAIQADNPKQYMQDLLQAKSRQFAPPTFMPDGLYFCGAQYEHIYLKMQESIAMPSCLNSFI